ncbi:MAG TPA: GIDE domain-containing protein, partial [candidate division Zixibacteria bacterium]|nr:GIDE domain-containing protein [candidate division Zixibacteria bacterium]
LRSLGVQCACVSEAEVRAGGAPPRAVSVAISGDRVSFSDVSGRTLCELTPESAPLVVIGSLNPERYGGGREILAHIVSAESGVAPEPIDRLVEVSRNAPAALVFPAAGRESILIVGSRFNYTGLARQSALSVSVNFQALVAALRERCGATIHEDFGRKTLPLTPLASRPETADETMQRLLVYGRLARAAYADGLYREFDALQSRRHTVDPVSAVTAGVAAMAKPQQLMSESSAHERQAVKPSLPPPPERPAGSLLGRLLNLPTVRPKYYGPPAVTLPLAFVTVVLITLSVRSQGVALFSWALVSAGAFLCVWALTMLLRKRTIEQLPTSGIRSLSMGEVEVCGYAKRKYALRSPFSLTNCVYYSYQVQRLKVSQVQDGQPVESWVTVERGDSGRLPFFLEDDTGRVLIDPAGALISGLRTEVYAGSMTEMLAGVASDSRRRVLERLIPEDARLYVIGHARPNGNAATEYREEYRRRLRELKADRARLA